MAMSLLLPGLIPWDPPPRKAVAEEEGITSVNIEFVKHFNLS